MVSMVIPQFLIILVMIQFPYLGFVMNVSSMTDNIYLLWTTIIISTNTIPHSMGTTVHCISCPGPPV